MWFEMRHIVLDIQKFDFGVATIISNADLMTNNMVKQTKEIALNAYMYPDMG